jgi:5-formyltetrahydrofolate cyclo-ligase
MTKAEYREIYKKRRQLLTDVEQKEGDVGLFKQLRLLDWTEVSYVHVYLSIKKFKEPDTFSLITYLKGNYPDINIVVSKTDFERHSMSHFLWDDHLVLNENAWGIPEPLTGTLVEEQSLDVVIIPLLTADQSGNRVGYGKGFYDQFLSKCREDVLKIGLSYFEPVPLISDVDDWDIPLDILLSPTGRFDCNKKGDI